MSRMRMVVAATTLTLAVAGCGGPTAHTPPLPSVPGVSQAPTPMAPATTTAPPVVYIHTYSFTETLNQGYRQTVKLELGRPGLAGEQPVTAGACRVDPQTDLLVPFRVTLAAATDGGFSTALSYDLESGSEDSDLELELDTTGGSSCNTHFGDDSGPSSVSNISSA